MSFESFLKITPNETFWKSCFNFDGETAIIIFTSTTHPQKPQLHVPFTLSHINRLLVLANWFNHCIATLNFDTIKQRYQLFFSPATYFQCMLHNSHSHQFFSVIATVHHHRVDQSLHNGARGFSESLHLISAGSVGQISHALATNTHIVVNRQVLTSHILFLERPLVEKFHCRFWRRFFHCFFSENSKSLDMRQIQLS